MGLGARDSLRLEAGLCLYGHELGPEITPVEARLNWAIPACRRPGGDRPGGYPGADVIAGQLATAPARRRVGLRVEGKRPVREGQAILTQAGEVIGQVSSGGFGPSVGAPVAMGFVSGPEQAPGSRVKVDVRGKFIDAQVVALPMVTAGYVR